MRGRFAFDSNQKRSAASTHEMSTAETTRTVAARQGKRLISLG